MVSSYEVHHRLSLAINKQPFGDIEKYKEKYESLFQFLLSLSCIQNITDNNEKPEQLFTKDKVDKAFEKLCWVS
jgi:hypothetical protein